MMTIEEFTIVTSPKMEKYGHRPALIMNDGFTMSVQGSKFNYCSPRENNLNEYASMEIGFPSEREDLIMEYVDGDGENPTNCVYGWVPCSVINDVIKKHGGINIKETFKTKIR